jgi:cellulose synthase/poly-beta-1,6-N-acetylglucosamine synthase-like glycosyltransferase/peptidoglycan/xylan/chitin deacetylase (PgdA/CDA1 family)
MRSDAPPRRRRVLAGLPTPPRAHRAIVGFCTAMVVVLLLVDGVTTKTLGAAGTDAPSADAPLAGSGPILVSNGHGGLVSHAASPGHQIALTFDDGPSLAWTPRILSILERAHVPATFFQMGANVVRAPWLTRRIVRDGFELGNHTFTHPDLATLPAWQRDLQLSMTESAFSGIAGRRTRLLRPPYASTPDAITPKQVGAWGQIAGQGYMIAVADYDTRDWDRPGVASIVAAATPAGQRGGIVMMHDAGGNRSETVAALPRVIAVLSQRGFRFVTVSELAGESRSAAMVPATSWQRLRGHLFVAMLAASRTVTTVLRAIVFALAVLVALRMAFVLALASAQVRRARRGGCMAGNGQPFAPAASIVVPAYNESVGIERCVRSLLDSDYPGRLEVIVVDDGSTDDTAELVSALGLERLRVVRQANAGKPMALNSGLLAAEHDILVTVDGDTVFEPGAIGHLLASFEEPDVGAVSGNTKVGNRSGLLGRWQHIEYVMGFNLDRRMYEVLNCMPTVPGAIGAFRRAALTDAGGFSQATLAEDTDIALAIGRAGWRVVYAEDARAWTEAPCSLRGLWRQRTRWAYGTLQSLWKHRAAFWRRGEGRIGRRALPFMAVFQVLLPLAAPLIDLFAIYSILFLDPLPILAFWVAFNVCQFALAWVAFGWDRESRGPLWSLPLQQIAYRQLMYLVVIDSVMVALMGTRLHWDRLARTGDVELAGGVVSAQAGVASRTGRGPKESRERAGPRA